jgi:hypothetical protein
MVCVLLISLSDADVRELAGLLQYLTPHWWLEDWSNLGRGRTPRLAMRRMRGQTMYTGEVQASDEDGECAYRRTFDS